MTSNLNKAFLIDVSEEDDSLLPAGKHRNGDDLQKSPSGHTGCTSEAADAIQKDDLLCPQVSKGPGNLALPVMTEEPVRVKKKKTGFNVRKSLAWNNAFFTEEGVLDSEELSLVNRTFQMPLGLPKPSTFKKPIQALKPLKPPMMPKINLTSHNTALTAESKENQIVSAVISPSSSTGSLIESVSKSSDKNIEGDACTFKNSIQALKPPMMLTSSNAALTAESKENQIVSAVISPLSSTGSLIESLPKSSEQHVNNIKGPNRLMSGVIAPISLANEQMGTSKKEKASVEVLVDSSESKLLLRRCLDKKDQGSSLPGINCYNGEARLFVVERDSNVRGAMASGSVSSKRATNLKQIVKDGRGLSQSVNMEAMRQSSLMKLTGNCTSSTAVPRVQPAPSCIKETASTKTQHTTKKSTSLESGTFASRDKPSGLRMPSPKLGFFDMSRTASQVAVPRERTGHGCGVTGLGRSSKDVEIGTSRYNTNQNQGLKHPAGSAKPSHKLLEASRKQTIEIRSSSSIPSAPNVHGHRAGVASMRVAPVHELSRPVSYQSNWVNKKVDSTEQVLQPRKNGQNGSTRGKPVRSQPGNSTVRNVPGQENLSPDCKDGKAVLEKCVVAQGLALGNPNLKIPGGICAIEAVQNVVEPSQKSVKFSPSTSQSLLGQGNVEESMVEVVVSRNQNCADTGRACTSQKREEWPREKSGVVQNSPPTRASPKHGQWSPVRRTIQQPGPFDCTKLVNSGL